MARLTGSTGNETQDMDGREALLEDCLPQLFDTYERALEDNIVDPVVFLVDCEDDIGAAMARSWEGDDAVDAAILANAHSDGVDPQSSITTTLARAFTFQECKNEVPRWFPYLSGTFDRSPPNDGFFVVVVTYGGAGSFTVPDGARPG